MLRPAILLGSVTLICSCQQGSGSDIGPEISRLSTVDYRVLVQDDQGRPVSSASVSVQGVATPGISNRRGRARVPEQPSGVRNLTVDGANGSAIAGDRLGAVTFAAALPDGGELPYVVHLPDLSASTGVTVMTGTQAMQQVLPDSGSSGAILTIGAGTSVGFGAATSVLLRSGRLAGVHLPGELPGPASGVRLWGAGVLIDPAGVTFAPGAQLSMPNDLGLAANAPADLFVLDANAGAWTRVAGATVDGTGARIVAPAGSVTTSGLHAFSTTVSVATSLSGRVTDDPGFPIQNALVRVGVSRTRTAADGTWTLDPIAAVDASGAARTVTVEIAAGRDWVPARQTRSEPLVPGAQSVVGDLVLESSRSTILRLQLIERGAVDPFRRMRVSVNEGLTFGIGIGDRNGRADFEDIDAAHAFGLLSTRVASEAEVFVAEAARFLEAGGLHHVDLQVFARRDAFWRGRSSNGSTSTNVRDGLGTGPIRFAAVVRGDVPREGFADFTNDFGVVNTDYGQVGQATATVATGASGVTVISACTMVDVDSTRLEVPLERARLQPAGSFDPYGLVRGQLTGGAGGVKVRRIRSTRSFTREGWYDEVFFGRKVLGDVPVRQDPAAGGIVFELGVPVPRGHLAAVEGVAGVGVLTVERIGFQTGLELAAGTTTPRDLALDLVADTNFRVGDALTNLDMSLAGKLTFDLAIELPDRTLVDVVRGVSGNMTVGNANNLDLRLPALSGPLQGARYLVALGGRETTGTSPTETTVEQRTMIPLNGGAIPFVRFLDVPDIVSPAPGATVSSTGFTVQYTVPISTLYTVVELRAATANPVRAWKAVLPASFDRFTFRELPSGVAQPLAPNITWTLKVTAARIETGPLSTVTDAYRRILGHWVGVTEAEREVNAFSSTVITVMTM